MEYLSLIICIIGALVYLFGDHINVKVAELGKYAFFAGLLAVLLK